MYGETRGFHTEKLREEYVKYRREGGGGEESRLVKEDQRSASPYRKTEACGRYCGEDLYAHNQGKFGIRV